MTISDNVAMPIINPDKDEIINSLETRIKSLRAKNSAMIAMHNRNIATMRFLRAENKILLAKANFVDEFVDKIKGLEDAEKKMDEEEDGEKDDEDNEDKKTTGGDTEPQPDKESRHYVLSRLHRFEYDGVTIWAIINYWLKMTWESWATNPYRVPPLLYFLEFAVLLVWIFGNITLSVYEASFVDGGGKKVNVALRGSMSAIPALFQFVLFFFPTVQARF